MQFVKVDDLKEGMRLAKPIYNKNGVLLYERDSKLSSQGIISVRNFGLLGIYVLEPAEPLPPMSQDDIEFEKFQAVAIFRIIDELKSILNTGRQHRMDAFADDIVRQFGRLDHKINFVQSLRSKADFIYRHSLNVAILCALISKQLQMRAPEQHELIIAAVLHDVGKLNVPDALINKKDRTPEDIYEMKSHEREGVRLAEDAFASTPNIKRMINQAFNEYDAFARGPKETSKLVDGARILVVANDYDKMTAMSNYQDPKSEIAALKFLRAHPEMYDIGVVKALENSVNFLVEGCSVQLTNGETGLVVTPNKTDLLRPVILSFATNMIIDLSDKNGKYADVEISDVMKTLDNRAIVKDPAKS